MSNQLIEKINIGLQEPLPGQAAQFRMAHVGRQYAPSPPTNARQAGVLALLYPRHEDWHLVLIERNRNKNDRHSGQISFPGGRFETSDGSLRQTAIREAEEEIGVSANTIKVLGGLTELYIPVSNYRVAPFVGYIDYAPNFAPQVSEVAGILEVPFSLFSQANTIQRTNLKVTEEITLKEVPHYRIFDKIVWGATAMILSELMALTETVDS